jgi:hypothetical protein
MLREVACYLCETMTRRSGFGDYVDADAHAQRLFVPVESSVKAPCHLELTVGVLTVPAEWRESQWVVEVRVGFFRPGECDYEYEGDCESGCGCDPSLRR